MRAPVRPIHNTNVETITGCDGGDAVVYGQRGESAAMPMEGEVERGVHADLVSKGAEVLVQSISCP